MRTTTKRLVLLVLALGGFFIALKDARAVPSFARQTGLECVACHVSWLELTTVGRKFKLGGYTLMKPASGDRPLVSFDRDGDPPLLPLAGFVQAALSHTANAKVDPAAGTDETSFPRQNQVALQQFSIFLAGRISDYAGGFAQWTYDGLGHHSSIDNVDLRLANRYKSDSLDVMYGLSLNNSPTMSDIFNTTPVWGFPFASSGVAPTPAASTLIQEGLAQQVAGLSAYSMWNQTVYAELGGYRTANGGFSVFRAGIDRSEAAVLQGTAPYWRLALQREWDEGGQSAMVGAFGLTAKKYPDPMTPTGPADKFRDVGVDAQYQYVTDAHRFSGQIAYIREKQNLDGTFAAEGSSNASNRLNSLSAKLTYYYMTKYGATLGYQRVHGDADAGLYATGEAIGGSVNGRPDSSAVIVELNWLPWRDRRFTLQYTAYQKFNGARTNYDGFGRNAKDNNTLYLLAWFPF
ncbi:MAG: cytochrome C [Caldimonas sp.]